MDDEESLIRALLASPHDVRPQEAYADWLDERRDPRGEFVRLRLALAALKAESSEAKQMRKRVREMAPKLPLVWLERLDSVTVWEHLRRIGEKVRSAKILPDALAVARATMERVRHNVVLLAERLPKIGYQFADPHAAYIPPSDDTEAMIAEIEDHTAGPMPLSLRAFYEVVGSVDLSQSSEQHRPTIDDSKPEVFDEAFAITPLADLHDELLSSDVADGRWCVCFGGSESETYSVRFPDAAADFRTYEKRFHDGDDYDDREWFVNSLRNVCGGSAFRGRHLNRRGDRMIPTKLMDELRRGFLEV